MLAIANEKGEYFSEFLPLRDASGFVLKDVFVRPLAGAVVKIAVFDNYQDANITLVALRKQGHVVFAVNLIIGSIIQ